jgi:phage host-nuclease inhibitor protein Gam
MSKARIKTPVLTIKTREQFETFIGEIATLKAKEQKYTAEMNRRITEVRADYENPLVQIATDISAKFEAVRLCAEENPGWFGEAKSLQTTHGTIGWRIGNPTLKTLSGFTWDRVLEKLRGLIDMSTYIRTAPEVNKQALLADRNTLGAEKLREVGVRVVQEETFFVEPNIETPEARMQEAA